MTFKVKLNVVKISKNKNTLNVSPDRSKEVFLLPKKKILLESNSSDWFELKVTMWRNILKLFLLQLISRLKETWFKPEVRREIVTRL